MTATGQHSSSMIWGCRRLVSAFVLASATRISAFQIMIRPAGISSINERIIGKKNKLPNAISRNKLHHVRQSWELLYHDREEDLMEEFVESGGGVRYEMVDLPDSMVDTTVFVGNLCEFVTDDMLSALFQQASALNFLPASIARKPNSSSMKYGFVTFPTIAEKEVSSFNSRLLLSYVKMLLICSNIHPDVLHERPPSYASLAFSSMIDQCEWNQSLTTNTVYVFLKHLFYILSERRRRRVMDQRIQCAWHKTPEKRLN